MIVGKSRRRRVPVNVSELAALPEDDYDDEEDESFGDEQGSDDGSDDDEDGEFDMDDDLAEPDKDELKALKGNKIVDKKDRKKK